MKKETPKNSAKKASDTEEKQTPRRTLIRRKKEISVEPAAGEDEIQMERRDAYFEPLIRKILRNLIESGSEGEIIPVYHPASGFTYKLKVSEKEEVPDRISKDFLENLVRLDILRNNFYDSVSTCPSCESPAITLHHRCPKCKSHHIEKISLTEHIPCGYINQRDKYIQNICPKCGKQLVEGEYKDMGRWYVCKECGERFEHSQFDVICRECNKNFTIEESRILEVPKFTLNPKRKKEIRQNVASLESISNLLTDLGFQIEMPASVIGQKSGMEYHFSLLARKQTAGKESVVTVDHEVTEDAVQPSPLILYIYKISEMQVDIPIFIALPKLSEPARKIAKGHDILIIEGPPEGEERIAEIKAEIQRRIAQKAIVQQEEQKAIESTVETEETPQTLTNASVNPQAKHKATPLKGMLKKLKRNKNTEQPPIEQPPAITETDEETKLRNIVFLLDGSSSMREGKTELSNFELATKAIENILTNPDPLAKDDRLNVIVFWDEIIRGFQKKVLYENVPMSDYIDPQKLNLFGRPKKNVGTPVWTAVDYAIEFLKNKKGDKIVKLITDAIDFPRRNNAEIEKLKNSSIALDFIIVGSENTAELEKVISSNKVGRFFGCSNVETLVSGLKLDPTDP
jgi:predicted RNA-binding Zn-ribbon protein involved in translation (DUF1610 family)